MKNEPTTHHRATIYRHQADMFNGEFEYAFEVISEALGTTAATAAALESERDEYLTMFENKYWEAEE